MTVDKFGHWLIGWLLHVMNICIWGVGGFNAVTDGPLIMLIFIIGIGVPISAITVAFWVKTISGKTIFD